MNISRVHTAGGTGVGAAGPVQRKSDPEVAETKQPVVQEAPAQGKRLAAFAEKIDARFENAIASNKLSEREVNALKGAAEEFQALMQRLGNADLTAEGSKRHFLHMLGNFTSQVGSILDAAHRSEVPPPPLQADPSDIAPAKPVPVPPSVIDTLA